jgi:DNA-3-methyladenine glycosylase I
MKIINEFGSFDQYIWQFTKGKTIVNHRTTLNDIPTRTKESDAMSKDLINRGFKFVGTTICYAFMQAAGMVNDHHIDCFRYKELTKK